ncbi:MAG: hypothetical protein P8126_11455 [Gammaproteobacteria bacterium]
MLSSPDLSRVGRDGFLAYVFEGRAGPGGRPLSLLSFALQHQAWPADPFAFKAVNLLIHLACGGLIFLITAELVPAIGGPGRRVSAAALALLVAALWLLHPVQLSAVLYVVQRMTLLSGFFTLLGLYLYLRLRRRDLIRWKNLALLAAAVYGCTVLAELCKENGILLPAYLLCLEFILLQGQETSRAQRRRILCLAVLPLAAAAAYLVGSADSILGGYAHRPFTLGQRLLTEAGVVLDYLKIIVLPRPSDFTLFHDDYPFTTGPLTGSAMIGLGGMAALVISAWLLRRRARLYSFAVAWFLTGQLLESTFIPLELYFEHRNYLPSFGVLLLLGAALLRLSTYVRSRGLAVVVLTAYPLATTAVTAVQMRLWSDPYKQAVVWADEHPRSRRALDNLWNIRLVYGETDKAAAARRRLEALNPGDLYPYIKQVTVAYCYADKRYGDEQWRTLNRRAAQAAYVDHNARDAIGLLLQRIAAGDCKFPDLDKLHSLILALAHNPAFRGEAGYLFNYAATAAVMRHDADQALSDIDRAVAHSPDMDNLTFRMRILLAMGRIGAARKTLEEMRDRAVSSPADYVKLSRAKQIFRRQVQSETPQPGKEQIQ